MRARERLVGLTDHPQLIPDYTSVAVARILSRANEIPRRRYRWARTPILPDAMDTPEFNEVIREADGFIHCPAVADVSLSHLVYWLIRVTNPRTVVETGVWHGVSSMVILSALTKNRRERGVPGRLLSIDLPPMERRSRVDVGAAVPDALRVNWTLVSGAGRRTIRRAVERLGTVDLFVHDSDHVHATVYGEVRAVEPVLKKDGFVVVDDAHTNSGFARVASEGGFQADTLARVKGGYIGILRKQ